MSMLFILGAIAWDRPIRLSGPLKPGARLSGRILSAHVDDPLIPGRLGGGGANAAVALAKAGRQVVVAGFAGTSAMGDSAIAQLAEAGVDVSLVQRADDSGSVTLILVEPSGERVILGLSGQPDGQVGKWVLGAPVLIGETEAAIARLNPSGVYLRAPLPIQLPTRDDRTVIAHWDGSSRLPAADIAIASADDLHGQGVEDGLALARALVGDRLRWLIVTHGANGAEALDGHVRLAVEAPAAQVVDATGAGDIFAAGVLDALTSGADLNVEQDMIRALVHGCAWGARAVEFEGGAPIHAPSGAFLRFVSLA